MGLGTYEATLKNKAVEKCWAAPSLSHVSSRVVGKSWMMQFLCCRLPCLMAGLEITASRTCRRRSKRFSPVGRLSRKRTRRDPRQDHQAEQVHPAPCAFVNTNQWMNTVKPKHGSVAQVTLSDRVCLWFCLWVCCTFPLLLLKEKISLCLDFIFLCKPDQTKELWLLIVWRRRLSHFIGYNEMF